MFHKDHNVVFSRFQSHHPVLLEIVVLVNLVIHNLNLPLLLFCFYLNQILLSFQELIQMTFFVIFFQYGQNNN